MRSNLFILAWLAIFFAPGAMAGEAEVRKGLQQLDPNIPIKTIKPSMIRGLYEVVIGADIYYVSGDGKYIISGNVFEAKTKKNLTDETKGKIYLGIVNKAGESGMIIYEPKGKVRHTLTVFTDVDCPYCRKFHKEVPDHLKAGIRIRYVVFPLRGFGTETYKKSVSVWCSKDRKQALTVVKSGGNIPQRECENPLKKNFELAHSVGVDGTPTIMTEQGALYRGYLPKAELHARLGLAAPPGVNQGE